MQLIAVFLSFKTHFFSWIYFGLILRQPGVKGNLEEPSSLYSFICSVTLHGNITKYFMQAL